MPRVARQRSESGYYHVMIRGNGKQILFDDDDARRFFLQRVYFTFKDEGLTLLAWCLMDNHAHLLVLDETDSLAKAMARINGSFAQRYNRSSGHVGHVFQDRYLCKPIEDERYLLESLRYIHNNPEEAGICRRDQYKWSSYGEYDGSPRLVDTSIILQMLGGRKRFRQFSNARSDPKMRLAFSKNPTTETLLSIASDVLTPVAPKEIAGLPRAERNRQLRTLRDVGFSLKQIERITGIGKGTILYATREDEA